MAILKHIAIKNMDYGEAQRYLLFQHDEHTKKPILDENGELIPRKEYYIDGINCDPFSFDLNQTHNIIKTKILMKSNLTTIFLALIQKIPKIID